MEVKYEFTRKDYWNFTKFTFVRIRILRYTLIIMVGLILFMLVTTLLYNISEGINFFIFNLFVWTITYNLGKWIIMRLPASKPGILGEHMIEISSNGLRERTQVNDGTVKWAGVIKILSNKTYIFIFIDNMVAHIVPKRAFSTDKEAEEFLNAVIKLWKENK